MLGGRSHGLRRHGFESRYRRALRQPSVGARLRHAPRYSPSPRGKLSPEETVSKTHAAERKALSLSFLEPRQVVRTQRTLFTQPRSGLTPRSSGPATAAVRASVVRSVMLHHAGPAVHRIGPLSSNVRSGDEQDSLARLAVAAMGCAGTASSHGIAVRFSNRLPARGFGMHQGTHPVRSDRSPQKQQ